MGRYVVTGAAGFIGSHVCEALVNRGDHVFGIDNFNDYYVKACGERFASRKIRNIAKLREHELFYLQTRDITDKLALETTWPADIDTVIHLAARPGVRASFEDKAGLYPLTNVYGTQNVLDVARAHGVKRFVIASSSSVYGKNPQHPWSEEQPLTKTESPYAETKRQMENLCRDYQQKHRDVRMAILRFFTVYGPRGRPDMFPYLLIDRVHRGERLQKFGDGTTLRDYTYIFDIVDGVLKTADRLPFTFEVFNLGNSQPVTLNDFIATGERVVGRSAEVQQEPERKGDVPITYADIAKARQLLDWEPTTSVEDGLRGFYAWYQANQER